MLTFQLMIGSTIAAIGQPFYLNSPSFLASEWFGANEIAVATSVGTISFPLGALIGFLMPNYFFTHGDPDLVPIKTLFHQQTQYLFVANLMVTVLAIGSLFMIKNKPPSPPS